MHDEITKMILKYVNCGYLTVRKLWFNILTKSKRYRNALKFTKPKISLRDKIHYKNKTLHIVRISFRRYSVGLTIIAVHKYIYGIVTKNNKKIIKKYEKAKDQKFYKPTMTILKHLSEL